MNKFLSLVSQSKEYLSMMLIFWICGGIILALYGYEESFLILNSFHHPFLDFLMPHLTHLGDGLLVAGILAFWIIRRDSIWVICLVVALFSVWIIVATSKGILFEAWPRPFIVFKDGPPINYISLGLERWHSFPSGHSTVAACVFFLWAFYVRDDARKWIKIGMAMLAIVACYSRVYIGVHFLGDILAGSLLGVFLGMGSIYGLYDRLGNWISGKSEAFVQTLKMALYILFGILWLVSLAVLISYYI